MNPEPTDEEVNQAMVDHSQAVTLPDPMRPEVRRAFEASWRRNAAGYRALGDK